MEISLEQIELVKDRTGVSYKEAKDALEFANGNVVDAIIYVEENINHDYEKSSPSAVFSSGQMSFSFCSTASITYWQVPFGAREIPVGLW